MHRRGLSMPSNFVGMVVGTWFHREDEVTSGRLTPKGVGFPPMPIFGTCVFFLTFPPAITIFGMRVRVVEGFPFGLILGTAVRTATRQRSSFSGGIVVQTSP